MGELTASPGAWRGARGRAPAGRAAPARTDRLPPHALEHRGHRERREVEIRCQLRPANRGRHRRAGSRADRVSGRDRLAPAVLPVVDEDTLPLLLQPLGREHSGVLLRELPRNQLGELIGLVKGRAPRDRHEDVDARRPARLHVGFELQLFQTLTNEMSDLDGEPPLALRWVEVEKHEIGPVRLIDPGIPGIHVDAVHLHHPQQRQLVVDEREVDEPGLAVAGNRPEPARLDPRRHSLRRLFLEERRAGDSFAPALHRERPVPEVRDEHRRDLCVVVEEVALRNALVGPEHTIRAGETDDALPASDLPRHGLTARRWRNIGMRLWGSSRGFAATTSDGIGGSRSASISRPASSSARA